MLGLETDNRPIVPGFIILILMFISCEQVTYPVFQFSQLYNGHTCRVARNTTRDKCVSLYEELTLRMVPGTE